MKSKTIQRFLEKPNYIESQKEGDLRGPLNYNPDLLARERSAAHPTGVPKLHELSAILSLCEKGNKRSPMKLPFLKITLRRGSDEALIMAHVSCRSPSEGALSFHSLRLGFQPKSQNAGSGCSF